VQGLRQALQNVIPDTRISHSDGDKAADDTDKGFFATLKSIFGTLFDIIFNNPIMQGIITRIINTIIESAADVIKIPEADRLINVFTKMFPDFIGKEAANLGEFSKDVFQKMQEVGDGWMDLIQCKWPSSTRSIGYSTIRSFQRDSCG
jgi:hypothetical protein